MHFPKYWARADRIISRPGLAPGGVSALGWSDVSEADAKRVAEERAARLVERAAQGLEASPGEYYPTRPAREPMLEEVVADPGNRAVVSRNRYGAEILNTEAMMMVDVDAAAPETPLAQARGCLAGLFSAFTFKAPAPPPKASLVDEARAAAALGKARAWCEANPSWLLRLYQTAAGLRYLVLHASFDPAGPPAQAAFQALDCDPKYALLCRTQRSFRARLTPKPWRCGYHAEGQQGFWLRGDRRARAERWLAGYREAGAGYAVCRFIAEVGRGQKEPRFAAIVERHDAATGVGRAAELA